MSIASKILTAPIRARCHSIFHVLPLTMFLLSSKASEVEYPLKLTIMIAKRVCIICHIPGKINNNHHAKALMTCQTLVVTIVIHSFLLPISENNHLIDSSFPSCIALVSLATRVVMGALIKAITTAAMSVKTATTKDLQSTLGSVILLPCPPKKVRSLIERTIIARANKISPQLRRTEYPTGIRIIIARSSFSRCFVKTFHVKGKRLFW